MCYMLDIDGIIDKGGICMRDKLLLIDAYSIICRGFYALPLLSNDKGLHTNAVLGFLNILYKNIDEVKPKYIAVAFDENKNTFRHELYKEYKGNRNKMPDELKEQVPYVKKILEASNIKMYSKEGFEADDILGTLASKFSNKDLEAVILSGDKDMLQLPTDNIKVRLVKTIKADSNTYEYYADDVLKEYSVTPTEFIDLKALQGDTSDNIPGVKGIGPKTATELIVKYKSIDGIYEHIDEITKKAVKNNLIEQKDIANFCKVLVTIKKDVPLDVELKDLELQNIFNENSFNVIKDLELKSQYRRFGKTSNVTKKETKPNTINSFDNPFDNKIVNIVETTSEIDTDTVNKMFNQEVKISDDNAFEEIKNESGFISVYVYKKDFTNNKSLIHMNDVCLACITTNKKSYIFNYDISDKILQLAKDKKIVFNDIKSSLYYFDKKENVFDNYFELKNKQNFEDISIMCYLIDPTKDNYNYENLYLTYLNLTVKDRKELLGKSDISDNVDYNNVPNEQLIEYMSLNTKINYLIYELLLSKLDKLGLKDLYYNVDLPLSYILYNMEKIGILLDTKELSLYDKMLDKKIELLTKQIHDLAGEDFNINSPKQLGEILFNKLKLDYDKKKNEKQSTSIEVLEKLYDKHDIVPLIIEYRSISKLSSTYAKGLPHYINEIDNRIHTNFNQTETATGRLSSDNPNLQNIPVRTELGKELRKVFIPREGYIYIDADYSQIELRLLAIISDDKKLIETYKSGVDVHTVTASQVFNVAVDKVTPDLRRKAKAVNFGIIYGISAFGLGEDLHIEQKEAKEYINKYFETYVDVKKYLDDVVKNAEATGFTKTLFGRIRPINEFKGNAFQKAFAKRVAMNAPLQGSASDIIKKAMILIDDEINKQKLSSRMILQVHDEILIETKIGEEDKIKTILNKCMKESFNFSVPLEINIEQGKNFEEVH